METMRNPQETIPGWVNTFTQRFLQLWWSTETSEPSFAATYTLHEKFRKEAELKALVDAWIAEIHQPPANEAERKAFQDRAEAALTPFVHANFGIDEKDISFIRSHHFLEVSQEFTRMARQFDPRISEEDIYQASRNVMTMNFLQLQLGLPVEMTPSVFAYSMLYPYSDNYLDDPDIPRETKIAFNQRFQKRLCGEDVPALNLYEEKIFHLIVMIEKQYDRVRYPQVYESLLAIHRAQVESMRLLWRDASPYEADVLRISFEKGGTSVLADGFLVAGQLSQVQAECMYGYGAFTQLMDDLEDCVSDAQAGLMTIFSQTAGRWPIDRITYRLFHFGDEILSQMGVYDTPETPQIQTLIGKCIYPLLLQTVGDLSRFYTRSAFKNLESHFPFRFSFLRQQRKRLEREKASMVGLIEILSRG